MPNSEIEEWCLRRTLLTLFDQGLNPKEATDRICKTYGDILKLRKCHRWFHRFKNGDRDLEDRLIKFNDDAINSLLESHPHKRRKELSRELGCSESTLARYLKKNGKRYRKGIWVSAPRATDRRATASSSPPVRLIMAQNVEDTEETFNESFVDEPSDDNNSQDFEEEIEKDSVAKLLAKLNSSGALVKKPVRQSYHCYTCVEDFDDIEDFHEHLIEHVSLPYICLKRVDADDSDYNGEDDEWESDNENLPELSHKPMPIKTENLTISKFLESNRGGLTITSNKPSNNNAALLSLKNFGNICIKKVSTIDDKDNFDSEDMSRSPTPDTAKIMETSGTLKLTIKHTGDNSKAFHVVNGSQNIKSEKTNSDNNNRLAMNEPVDTKHGILEACLKHSVKEEPIYPDDHASSNSSSQNILAIGNVSVKSETSSRPHSPADSSDASGNHIKVKEFAMQQSDKESQKSIIIPKPMIIPKVETENIIEINCDSDKDDDEIIFVGSSALPDDKKSAPIVPKVEPYQQPSQYTPKQPSIVSSANSTPSSISSNSHISTAKEHSFNWNAPQSKHNDSLDAMLSDKNADALFESLLSTNRKDDIHDNGPSEYISLDKLGPQHTCETCNTTFTSIERMENHKRITGHSNQLAIPTSNSMALSTYHNPSSGYLMNNVNSLLPVKQLAETVSKIASGNASNQFTHQQNITVNIQSYPGSLANQQHAQQPAAYNYPGMSSSYQPAAYRMPNQNMHAPYPQQYAPPAYPNAYSQYPQPQQPMYNHMNAPYPSQPPMQPQAYPSSQYPNHQPGQLISPYSTPVPPNNQNPPVSSAPQIIPLPNPGDHVMQNNSQQNNADGQNKSNVPGGIKIQSIQTINSPIAKPGPRIMLQKNDIRGQMPVRGVSSRGGRGGAIRGVSPMSTPGVKVAGQAVRGMRPGLMRGGMKRPAPSNGTIRSPSKKRMDMLIPDRHDNEDCQVGGQRVISMQNQRDGLPMIQSIQGSSRDKTPAGVQLGSQLTVTKTRVRPPTPPVTKDTSAMASILASRGIKITPKQKPNIPNLGSNISITSSRSSSNNFSIHDDTPDYPCNHCNKSFSSNVSLSAHIAQSHNSQKTHNCDSCILSFSTYFQLQDHRLKFHTSLNAEIGIPVVELSQQSTIRKLINLGITNIIPLGNRDHGTFGIPIVSAHNALNGNLANSLQQLGAEGILQLGPVKPLPKC